MIEQIVVVDSRTDLPDTELVRPLNGLADAPAGAPLPVVTAREYLAGVGKWKRGTRVVNLCRDLSYLGTGYHVSLLAEARGHRAVPTVKTLTSLPDAADGISVPKPDDGVLPESAQPGEDGVLVIFGRTPEPALASLAEAVYERCALPVCRLWVEEAKGRWTVDRLRPESPHRLDPAEKYFLAWTLHATIRLPWRSRSDAPVARYDIAILWNPKDTMPPSDAADIRVFRRVGKAMGIGVKLIGRSDYNRLGAFDALFIRETTRINHHTYRFARKAEKEGLAVLDDPDSILRCSNKVYLAELLAANKVPTPPTRIVQRGDAMALDDAAKALGFPLVLKIPDGSFSQGVYKANSMDELRLLTVDLFKRTGLLLAQGWCYTPFDWRIGILDRKPLFACQYFMSPNHWQIINNKESDHKKRYGQWKTMQVEDAPKEVVEMALKAANLIGDGLYGVDLKETGREGAREVVVIEVNDNPNIQEGVEDIVLGDELFRIILASLITRVERLRGHSNGGSRIISRSSDMAPSVVRASSGEISKVPFRSVSAAD